MGGVLWVHWGEGGWMGCAGGGCGGGYVLGGLDLDVGNRVEGIKGLF